MGFFKPRFPDVDPDTFLRRPLMERGRILTESWVAIAEQPWPPNGPIPTQVTWSLVVNRERSRDEQDHRHGAVRWAPRADGTPQGSHSPTRVGVS
jgi:hypothetical protein